MDLTMFTIPAELKEMTLPVPEELTYWESRKNRIFYVDYEIDDDMALVELSKVIVNLNFSEKDIPAEELKPIYIFVHTYGGDVLQALYFCDLIRASRIPIYTVSMGATMSAGFYILISGQKRFAFEHSSILCHSGSLGVEGSQSEVDSFYKSNKKRLEDIKKYILTLTNIPEKDYNKNKNKDWYMTAEEALQYGVIDKIITSVDDMD